MYAELGTSFANSAVAHLKFCAALVGTLIKGYTLAAKEPSNLRYGYVRGA